MSDNTSPAPDDSYAMRPGQDRRAVPVTRDENVEAGAYADRDIADSDQQLDRDEKEIVDQSAGMDVNEGIKTRGATKEPGAYREPGDEEGLPGPEDGTSRVR